MEEWGSNIQLLLDMDVELPNSKLIPLKILGDTGAQANLVRRGAISPFLWQRARNPVRLVTSNSSTLAGGDHTINLGLFFIAVEDGYTLPEPLYMEAEFYSADIEVDAICPTPG